MRAAVLRVRDVRRYFVGYVTSLLGTSMASVATAFAIFASGGGGTELGLVMAAAIAPQVVFVLSGGVFADRLPRRSVMLGSDIACCCAQGAVALAMLTGHASVWVFVGAAALRGTGEAFFSPALTGLLVEIAPTERLVAANALVGVSQSVTRIAGPALAGVLVAAFGAGLVIAVDALSYLVSVCCLATLHPRPAQRPHRTAISGSMLAQLRAGWAEFRSRTWLWLTTVQMGLFNLLVWAPFLVLGPLVARERLGGAQSWGAIMAGYGAGALFGGVAVMGHRPRRPVRIAVIAALGWAFPSASLAMGLPLFAVVAAAVVAGIGSAVDAAFMQTATQRTVPAEVLGRISSLEIFGAFGFGPLGLALAGPAAELVGLVPVFAFGACWQLATCVVVAAAPPVRALTLAYPGDGADSAAVRSV